MYSLKTQYLEPEEILLSEGDETTDLIFVQKGCLQVYTHFEGNEFILDFLPAGSILNQLIIFTGDLMHVNVRATPHTHILKFSLE